MKSWAMIWGGVQTYGLKKTKTRACSILHSCTGKQRHARGVEKVPEEREGHKPLFGSGGLLFSTTMASSEILNEGLAPACRKLCAESAQIRAGQAAGPPNTQRLINEHLRFVDCPECWKRGVEKRLRCFHTGNHKNHRIG